MESITSCNIEMLGRRCGAHTTEWHFSGNLTDLHYKKHPRFLRSDYVVSPRRFVQTSYPVHTQVRTLFDSTITIYSSTSNPATYSLTKHTPPLPLHSPMLHIHQPLIECTRHRSHRLYLPSPLIPILRQHHIAEPLLPSLSAPTDSRHGGNDDGRAGAERFEEATGGGVGVEFGHGNGALVDVDFERVGEFGEGGGGGVRGEEGEDGGTGYAWEDGAVEGWGDDIQACKQFHHRQYSTVLGV